jgi:hypothetical protein
MNIEELRYLTQRPQRKTVVKGKRQTLISRIDTKVKGEKRSKRQEARSEKIAYCQLST